MLVAVEICIQLQPPLLYLCDCVVTLLKKSPGSRTLYYGTNKVKAERCLLWYVCIEKCVVLPDVRIGYRTEGGEAVIVEKQIFLVLYGFPVVG